ncbi:MAG: N-6 DNA methylase [Alphaproteobacteria bacterium]|nr:N-6 DNA methylase [Alphaproteobacteria bacterium]
MDSRTKQTIDNACDTLVGKVPSPQTQVDIITTALIYKFMDDMDLDGLELSDKRTFFVGDLEPYAFSTIVNTKGNQERMNLYLTGLEKVQTAKSVPELFRRIFKEAMIPFRDPTTFALFLKEINELKYDDSETLGDAFEYLLNKMATAKNAGQFRTPRNIIDFIVDVVKPTKDDTILDPACGTAGFLISAYKHITSGGKLTPDELKRVTNSIVGLDIDPTMVKLSLVNLYLHKFEQPNIYEYDTLSNDTRWGDRYDVILANPPFMTPKGGITPHKRFAINANRSEVLFADYFMEHLTINGRAGFVVPEGIIFQTANAYKELRKMMLDGFLYAVVSLPSGVFNPYAGVKTSILFFDRAFAKTNDNILFVRVDNDGFSLGAQRTPIKQNDLPEALKIINEYRDGKDVSGYERAMVVSKERIAENNYDLTAAKYIEKETRECKYEMVKLEDVTEIITKGTTPTTLGYQFVDDGVNFIKIESINDSGVFIPSKFQHITNDCNNKLKRSQLQENDILFSIAGAFGRVGVVNKDILPANTNQALAIIRLKNQIVLPKYIATVLKSSFILDKISALKVGVAQFNISLTQVANLEIPLPPLDVQQQIVDEIENKQSAINHAREIIKNLERERDNILPAFLTA